MRHLLATTMVVAAFAIVAAVFVFARPQYRPYETKNYDMATRPHYTVREVREAFAAHGVDLRYQSLLPGANGAWMVSLAAVPFPVDVSHLNVSVFGPRAKIGWNTSHQRLEAIRGNVAVTYDGRSGDVVRRAKAAIASLP